MGMIGSCNRKKIIVDMIIMVVLICFHLTVIWKLAGKLLAPTPKQSKSPAAESQSSSQGLKWSFAAGTNLLSQLGVKIEKQSQQKLNEFAQELRAFPFVDMSGMLAINIYDFFFLVP